jgi:hypothetical protein
MGKCTSWLGHKFEARYSSRPTTLASPKMQELFWLSMDDRKRLTQPIRTYECDVCTRCGHVVQKVQP